MIYPLKVLQIETTNFCNSKCVFCVHSQLKRFGTMSDKLFKKIILDSKEIPTLEMIVPMLLGEPFCDKKIIQRLKFINKILPGIQIVLFTNGSLLTHQKIKELVSIKNLYVYFSLNGFSKETRKKLMTLSDFDYVISMIKLYEQTGKPFTVNIVKHPSISNKELESFKSLPFERTQVITYKNWSGDKFEGRKITHCKRAIGEMTIMWDGLVNLCCMDGFGKVIFGDTNISSLKSIWKSAHRQMYARSHSEGNYLKGLCSNCTGG